MWNDTALKYYMDATVNERLEDAQRGYEMRRARRLCDLLGALRRVQAELDFADHARPTSPRVAARG